MTDDDHREFVLAALRTASLRCKLMDAELATIGVSLKARMISPELALQWAHDEGLMGLFSMMTDKTLTADKALITEQPNEDLSADSDLKAR